MNLKMNIYKNMNFKWTARDNDREEKILKVLKGLIGVVFEIKEWLRCAYS